jgi:tetratricopeptide (TPR) repeat protein
MMRLPLALALAVLASSSAMFACNSSRPTRSPYASQGDLRRDPDRAEALHQEALTLLRAEGPAAYAEAEPLLREALAADLYHRRAHNNLGIILLDRGELYEAASEFEWARKLNPGWPEPRVNLALALERAGKTSDAIAAYDSALAVADGYLPAIEGKASLQVRTGRTDEATPALLEEIALRSDESWREWANLWKVKLSP